MPAETERSTLKKQAAKGGVITLSAKMATVAVQIASIVILSRLLAPEDFGVIAMVTAITAFVGLFRDAGLSTASIQKGSLTADQTNTLFWLNVAVGAALTVIVILGAPAIAWFYGRPELTGVAILLSTTFFISAIGAQHGALMLREMRFLPKAVGDIVGASVTMASTIGLAALGYSYWALAWGLVLGAMVTTVLYFYGSNFRPMRPRRADGIRQLVGFGADVTAFEVVNYFHRNLDNVLIGRLWGATTLGLYSRAYQMMMLPIVSLRAPINAVAFSALSRLQNDPEEFRRYYIQIASLLALLSMPLMAFMVMNAHDVTSLVLGARWLEVVPIFIFLGITGFIQPVASLRGLVMLSLGRSRRYLIWGVVNSIATSLAFAVGVKWGAEGLAAAYALCNYLILLPSMSYAFRDSPLSTADFFKSITLPAGGSIFAAAACALIPVAELSPSSPAARLFISGLAFGLALVCFYLTLPVGRKAIKTYIDLARLVRRK